MQPGQLTSCSPSLFALHRSDVHTIMFGTRRRVKYKSPALWNEKTVSMRWRRKPARERGDGIPGMLIGRNLFRAAVFAGVVTLAGNSARRVTP
jgi:hypothetical protein